jgi:hypothetical protein
MVSNLELITDFRHACLDTREAELVDRERRLVEAQLHELAVAHQRLEELQVTRAGEAQKVWDFLGQTEATLAPLGFSPICPVGSVGEVTAAVPQLESMGAKMSQLEEVISDRLEIEGHVLTEVVAEHVLL